MNYTLFKNIRVSQLRGLPLPKNPIITGRLRALITKPVLFGHTDLMYYLQLAWWQSGESNPCQVFTFPQILIYDVSRFLGVTILRTLSKFILRAFYPGILRLTLQSCSKLLTSTYCIAKFGSARPSTPLQACPFNAL